VPIAVALLIALLQAALAGSTAPPGARLPTPPAVAPPAHTTPDAGPQPRRVLALYWYGPTHPVTATFDRQFQAVLNQQGAGEVVRYTEYLQPGFLPDQQQARVFRDYLGQKYADRKVDVVFCWGSATLGAILQHHDALFPGAPIVYYSSSLEAVKGLPAAPMTGVLNPGTYARTLDLALRLHPDTTDVFVISGTANRDKSIEREAAPQLATFEDRVRITYLTDLPLERLIATVRGLPRRSLILYSRQSHEDPDRVLQPFDFLGPVSQAASVPVYAPWRSHLGSGVVGGVVDDPVAGATKAATMVLRVVRGARPQDIPTDRVPTSPAFDARQLARFGIGEDRLPAGSVVLFRAPTAWSRYKAYIIGSAVVFALQTLLIGALLLQRARRRRVEAALRESEQQFRMMADTAPVMIWRSDTTKGCDFFNKPWLEFRGRSLQEESGWGWARGVHPDDSNWCVATYSTAFDERRPFDLEYRLQRADGEYRWVMEAGIPRLASDGAFAGYIGSAIDITDRKRAEEALRESERRYALATAAGAVGVWDWNLETGRIYVDPAIRRALDVADGELDTRLDSWTRILPAEGAGRMQADVQACVDGVTPFFEDEFRRVVGDGSTRWFLIRGSVAQRGVARATRITGTVMDITDRKRAELNLEETRHELARVARVTSLAQSAAYITHELSQPLASIQMNIGACLRWLKGPAVPTDELHGALLDVAEAAALARGVITRDRELFRRHSVEKQVLDANGIVADVASLARARLQQTGVVLDLRLDRDLPPVRGDRVELQQVLLNLLLNGIEAMEAVDPSERRLTIETRLTGDLVQTTVEDTGPGIPEADAERLFTPFYTTKPRGTGIGLSISRFIIDHHGGRLWADRSHGLGARFRFTVPVATAEATGRTASTAARRGSLPDAVVPGTRAS
jgi:PAS domain S-box-containing protein